MNPLSDAEIRELGYEPLYDAEGRPRGWLPNAEQASKLDAIRRDADSRPVELDGSVRDVLDRLLAWTVVDQDGQTVITGERAEVIRFARATTFIATTDFITDDDRRLWWLGWLQVVAQRANSKAVMEAIGQQWRLHVPLRLSAQDRAFPEIDSTTREIQDREHLTETRP